MAETESSSPEIFIPEDWSNAAEGIADSLTPPSVFVCGPKNSGKTTFSRHLVNVLLQRYSKVAYLDTDVGQTEFTPPGLLSLTIVDKITPDLTIPCLKTPERCYFFGDISSKRNPTAYLTYIFSLYDYYRKKYPMKNKTGIGYELLVDMLKYVSPTHVVKIFISSKIKNLPPGSFWLDEATTDMVHVIEISSARQDHLKRSLLVQKDSSLLRDLRVMAYFRQCFSSKLNISTIKELARALAAYPPYEICVSSVKIKNCHCEVPKTETFYCLNASIVGLAVSSEVSDQLPHCVGLGIVRGIDTFKGLLYVITPVPQQILKDVDLLLQGFSQIPTCLLKVQGCTSPYMAANVLSTN